MTTVDLNEIPTGPYGSAERLARDLYAEQWPATLDVWLLTAQCWHPLWSQYGLNLITLADCPGVPPAVVTVPGATHELMVGALNPERGPFTSATFVDLAARLAFDGVVLERAGPRHGYGHDDPGLTGDVESLGVA